MTTAVAVKKPGLYYGWIIAAACFAITMTLAEAFYAYGLFFEPLERQFGWSRAMVSSAYTFLVFGYSASAFIGGRLGDKYGPRPIIIPGALLTAGGLVLCSQVTNIWQFRLFMFITGIGAGTAWPIPAATITRWFVKKRGLMLGIMGAGVGLGSIIFIPLISYFITQFGWRTAFTLTGIIYGVVVVSAGSLMVHSPERKGLRAYGADEVKATAPRATAKANPAAFLTEMSMGELLRTSTFWSLLLVIAIAQFPVQVLMVHLVRYSLDVGIAPAVAAVAFGLFGGFSIPGRVLGGAACDRIGWVRGFGFSLLALGAFTLWLLVMRSPWMLFTFIFFYGFVHGSRNPAQTGILGYYFGTRSLGQLIGLVQSITLPIGALGPYVAGLIYDSTGSYALAFVIMAITFAIAGVAVFFLKPAQAKAASSHQ